MAHQSSSEYDTDPIMETMHPTSSRACCLCKNTIDFQELRQCSHCGARGEEPPYFCVRRCYAKDCRTRNCSKHPSCWEAHLPGIEELRILHRKIDPLPQIYVNAVTYSEPDPAKQRDLHEEDRVAQWFIVKLGTSEREPARLCVSDRFRQLCNPGISENRWTSSQYPSFVSFIGDTGTGKSTLVRAMILMGQMNSSGLHSPLDGEAEGDAIDQLRAFLATRMHGPVTRTANINHLMDPTSSGVHLYKDSTAQKLHRLPRANTFRNNVCPILFADCEGFRGGIAKTNSERPSSIAPRPKVEELNPYLLFDRPIDSPEYGANGKEGAELLYARFLYAFSDVVVFVTKEDQRFQEDMQKILEWAASAVDKSINHLAQKTLIIVRHMANQHVPQFYNAQFLKDSMFDNLCPVWEGSATLAEFRKKHNRKHSLRQRQIDSNRDFFEIFFQECCACYIPDKDKAPMDQIFSQYRDLRQQIVRASETGQDIRSKSWTQYNIPTLSHLLNRAFEHFRASDEPFDFYKAARKDNPNPVSVSDHIANFMRHIRISEGLTTQMFPEVVSICLVSCALRRFQQAWEPEDIFQRDLRPFCEEGIRLYREKYQNCGFKFGGGLACIARRHGHEEHCDEKGTRVPGKFDPSEFQEDITGTIDRIRELFIDTYKELCTCDEKAPSLPDPGTLQQKREEILGDFRPIWRMITSNKTCFSCLQSVPDHVLSCGHSYCPDCVKEFGRQSSYYEYGLVMDCCVLCQKEWRDEHSQLIRLRPKCAGIRILTLDGGGVRGIVELTLLEILEQRMGLGLSLRDFFDLIMGTSTDLSPAPDVKKDWSQWNCPAFQFRDQRGYTVLFSGSIANADTWLAGGIISLGLVTTKFSATDMKNIFTELASDTFKYRREGFFTRIDRLQITSKTLILLRIWDSVYRTSPLKQGLRKLFGDVNLYSSARIQQHQRATRVAVTSTKDTAANRCLITNYNRPDFSGGEDFEREDEDEKDMKIWEAGLATAAAPFYFRPFEKSETMKNYVDGALHANLPIEYALEEMANLWPSLDTQTSLDALVSVGTGIQSKELQIPKIMEIGGFKEICTNFQNNINTERIWEKWVNHPSLSPGLREKTHRLNAHIEGDYVGLDDYRKMGTVEKSVFEQAGGSTRCPTPLSLQIDKVVDTLTASLFFFEPEPPSLAKLNYASSVQNRRHELKGTIRCRLARNSQELKKLLSLVDGFCQQEIPKSAQSPSHNRWTNIRLPDNWRNSIRTEGTWFRISCTISTCEPKEMLQVIAVTLVNFKVQQDHTHTRVPISGFPISLHELQRIAMST